MGYGASPTCEVIRQGSLGHPASWSVMPVPPRIRRFAMRQAASPCAVGNIPPGFGFLFGSAPMGTHHVGQGATPVCGKAAKVAPGIKVVACPPSSRRINLAGPALSRLYGSCFHQNPSLSFVCTVGRSCIKHRSTTTAIDCLEHGPACVRRARQETKYPISSDSRQPWAWEHSSSP